MNSSASNKAQILADGQKVLQTEAQALDLMQSEMPADFVPVVTALYQSKGRVIVSGMGKSGHIARKISATFASTGTPSHFVHPAEASHGDMGMITDQDVCILISNSGEAAELRDMLAYTRRFSIPLVGISSRPSSTLMKAADYLLTLPAAPEACSIGMAPTTSTTMTLALGDALAVALMKQRSFAAEDFHKFHPGGKLGAQMATVADLMHTGDDVPLVGFDTPMSETLITMTAKGFGLAGVTRDGKLIGVISDGDLRRNIDDLMDHTAQDIASTTPVTISPDSLAPLALAIMNERKIGALMVVDADGTPMGVLRLHDCLSAGVA